MPLHLPSLVVEESSLILTVSLKDEDGALVDNEAITSMTWTLLDHNGTVVNEREDVVPESITNPLTILLYGDDLSLDTVSSTSRILHVHAEYTSNYGIVLPVNEELHFTITDLFSV